MFSSSVLVWAACGFKGGRRSAVMFHVLSIRVLRNVSSQVRGWGLGSSWI